MNNKEKLINIGIISISDRAFKGIYQDKGIPTIKNVLQRTRRVDVSIISIL